MSLIQLNKQKKGFQFNIGPVQIWNKYQTYASNQNKDKIFWYMKVIIILPCVIMVPAIIAMHWATDQFVWFIGLCMLLFFTNVMIHVAELKSKVFVPIYHLSILIMIAIPIITLLIQNQ